MLLLGSAMLSHSPSYRPLFLGYLIKPGKSEFFLDIFQVRIGKWQSVLSGTEATKMWNSGKFVCHVLPMWRRKKRISLLAERERDERWREGPSNVLLLPFWPIFLSSLRSLSLRLINSPFAQATLSWLSVPCNQELWPMQESSKNGPVTCSNFPL